MTDLDERLRVELEELVPTSSREADWRDVLRRQRGPRRVRTRLLLAAAVALAAVIVTAAGVAAALGGFDSWLSGEPGEPATPEEAAQFQAANRRSWAAFPEGTKLRALIRTVVGGREVTLFGLRSGNALCLRIEPHLLDEPESCAPVSTLAHLVDPVLVFSADTPLIESGRPPTEQNNAFMPLQATFGIAADGVRSVELVTDDGSHQAILAGNAFLLVQAHTPLGTRVRQVSVTDAHGRRSEIPFAPALSGREKERRPSRPLPGGPTEVEAKLDHPQIGWLERHEPRGKSLEEAGVTSNFVDRFVFARVVRPDPLINVRMLVGLGGARGVPFGGGARGVCIGVLQTGSFGFGCKPPEHVFSRGPLTFGLGLIGGGNQFAQLDGAVADGVAKVAVFLSGGGQEEVPLRDNVFFAFVPRTHFPIRIVAYNSGGRVVATTLFRSSF